jgi:sugar/nucleoside kinase (ribokinase family)
VTTLRYLVEGGHRISFDGQGLVREAAIGTLREDDQYDRAILSTLSILKVAEEEAVIVAGESLWEEQMMRLEVPEVVATLGSAGCDIFTSEGRRHVPAARPVLGVHTTGAGEVFAVAYAALRASGIAPMDAASGASAEVAEMLELRT